MATSVLVVDDEPAIRDLVVFHLEREGFRVRTARTGADALKQVKTSAPDLVILDLMLPELDGLEVCRRLRHDPATSFIPVIMLTAKGDEVDRIVGLEIGADDYVTKPFSPKELVARVRAVLRRSLIEARGRVLSRELLLDRVWGYARAGKIESRTVDVHVRRLRQKLGAEGRRILAVKNVGYRFEEAD